MNIAPTNFLKCMPQQIEVIHAKEVKLELQQLINKFKKLNLVPLAGSSQAFTTDKTCKPKTFEFSKYLLPFGIVYINKKLPMGVEPIHHMFIWEPEHGIFHLNNQNQMCFQCTKDLPSALNEHLFHLRLEYIRHKEFKQGYHVLISLELNKCLEYLDIEEYR
ncbi:unnamed protein product [Lactuca saligna]|uniref:Uncharacterized protein n=1 Tax=Lactuca saligna TaxID=75948 RepID=A0AA36EC67_LACSI|nr:unnamed protein product [Lactuca saligna]